MAEKDYGYVEFGVSRCDDVSLLARGDEETGRILPPTQDSPWFFVRRDAESKATA